MIDRTKLDSYLNKYKMEFSKTEKIVHDYVIQNPQQVIYETMNSIANKLDVGEASIVRYFKKLGFDNFVRFKMAVYNACEDIRIKRDAPFIENITENMVDAIHNTKKNVQMNVVNQAAEIICNAENVFIAGMGISHTTALDMFSKLLRIGVQASVQNDSHFSYMYTTVLGDKSCAIIYSFSGETEEMIHLAQNCIRNKTKVIAISNYNNSTLASLADVFLQSSGFDNDLNGGFFSSKVSQIYISDILVTCCALKDADKSKRYNQLVTNSLLK